MSWKDILKSNADHKRIIEMSKKVLRELGLDKKYVDDRAIELANSEKLFMHIPFHPINEPETDEEMYAQVTEESLKDIIMADKGFYLPNLLDKDERFKQQKRESWDEAGHEIVMELQEAIDRNIPLPSWAVLTKDGGLDEGGTYKKFINEATREESYWSIDNYR